MAHKQHSAPKTTDLSHSKVAVRTPEQRRKDRLTTTTPAHRTADDKGLTAADRQKDALRANGHSPLVSEPVGLAQAAQSGNNVGSGGSEQPELGTGLLAAQQAQAEEQDQQ